MAEISSLSFGDGNDLTLNKDELKKELKKTDFKEEKMQTVFEKFFDKKTPDGKLDAQERTAMFDTLAQAAKASGEADNLSEEEAQAFITSQGVEDISTADLFGFVKEVKTLSAAAATDENVDGADDDSDSDADTDVDENPTGDGDATVKEEPDNKEKWGKFAEKDGVEMTCRDASRRTQPIQGKFEIVSENYDKNPEQFAITDSSSGKAHKYLFEKTGVDSEGNPIYKCVSMNGVEFEDNAYTLKWSDDGTPELVQTEDQANYGVGLKKKAQAPAEPPAAAAPEDPPAATDPEDPPAAADPEDPPATEEPPAADGNKGGAAEVKKEDCRETALKNPMVYYNEATKTHYIEKDGKMVEYRPAGLSEGEKLVQVNADGSFVGEYGGREDIIGHSVYNKNGQEIRRNFGKSKDKFEPDGGYSVYRYHANGKMSRATYYDENKKPDFTEDYDTQGRLIKMRYHQEGITSTWKYLNDGSYIIEEKNDNGKTRYLRQPAEGDSYPCDKDGNKIGGAAEVKKEDCRETALKNPMVYYNEATKTHYIEKDGKMVEYRPKGLPEGEKLVQVNADGSFVGEYGGGEYTIDHSVYNKQGQEIRINYGKSKDKWEPSGAYKVFRYHANGQMSRGTYYDVNKKPDNTKDYDTQGRDIKRREHQLGITYTWKYLNDSSYIIEEKNDNGKTRYMRQPKEGDSYPCDKDGNKIEE